MNLPNYFLADLPPEASLSPAMITEACQALKRNRQAYLAHRSTQSLVELLTRLAKDWLDPDFPFRKLALDDGPKATGFSRATLATGLDFFFKRLTADAFEELLVQDLGHTKRLDHFTATAQEQRHSRASMAMTPELLVHIAAGNLPNPAWMSMILGVLTRSAQFVKCATGGALLPHLFAHSIYHTDPKLGACLEVAEWRGGSDWLEQALFVEAGCVTATGTDETLGQIRQKVPSGIRFLGYGVRVSFAYVAREALSGHHLRKVAERAAQDITAWNQLGCLSPHVIYIEGGSMVGGDKFAELLAEVLAERELSEPRGELPVELAAVIASRRSIYELRAASSPDTRLWCSENSTAWTVVYEADPQFQSSCLNRFIYVKEVKDLTAALQSADPVRGKVSTVGLAAADHNARELASELARWGVSRICPLGQMQDPPLAWRHDGRPCLGELVTWSDWEQ
jgi:hypothetical protein